MATEQTEERAEAKAPTNIRQLARKLVADQLTSVKLTKSEAKKRNSPMATSSAPSYPWGLSLTLEDEALKKLKLATLPTVGSEIYFVACAKVTRAEQSHSEGGKLSRSVSLQVTELALAKGTPRPAPHTARKRTA